MAILLIGLGDSRLAHSEEGQTNSTELNSAIALYRADGPEAALIEFERLRDLFAESGDVANQATTTRYIGESHWRSGNFNESRIQLDQALTMIRKLGNRYSEGKTLNVLGLLEWDTGNFTAAIEAIGRAHVIAEELGDKQLMASTLNNLSLVYDELGDYQKSLGQYQRALALFREIDNKRGQGDVLGNIGGTHLLLGHFKQALDYYEQALEFSEQLGSRPAMTIDHGNLALCYLGLGQVDQALLHFDHALKLAEKTGMRQEEAYWQRGKANALIRMGEYDLGMENHRAALSTYEEIGARGLLLEALHDMGKLHLVLGDPVSAEQYFRRAIGLAREIELARAVTVNLIALGDLQIELGRLEEANALLMQAYQRSVNAGELYNQAVSQLHLSLVNRERQKLETASGLASNALSIAEEIGARTIEAEAWYAIGELEKQRENLDEAFKAYSSAQSIAGTDGDPDLLWKSHFGRAQVFAQAGDLETAVSELRSAVEIIERVRSRLKEERFQAGYVQDKYQVYIELVRLQLKLGRTRKAFSTAERLRARSFLSQLDKGKFLARTENERKTEMGMRERIRQLQGLLQEEQATLLPDRRHLAIQTFSTELMLAERDYQAFLDDLDSSQITRQTINLPTLDEIQNRLSADEALVEYLVTEDNVLMFVVRNNRLTAASSDLKRANLYAKINLLRELVQQPDNKRWLKPASSLTDLLVAPLRQEDLLEGVNHINLIPHGVLNDLPFALLPAGENAGDLLIENYTLSYLPAASAVVRQSNGRSEGHDLLAMAPEKTQLRFALEEAHSIAELFQPNARLLSGKNATETALKVHAQDYRILHFATHGYFNKKNPLLSGLRLEADVQNDGFLEVHEIFELSLNAKLVTLSACQTGLGSGYFNEIPVGDDLVGLTRAFLVSGAGSVLATLWEVNDHSTVRLMQGFYQHLGIAGIETGTATALALVQRKMRSSKEFNHPFYWAPFVLVGLHDRQTMQL